MSCFSACVHSHRGSFHWGGNQVEKLKDKMPWVFSTYVPVPACHHCEGFLDFHVGRICPADSTPRGACWTEMRASTEAPHGAFFRRVGAVFWTLNPLTSVGPDLVTPKRQRQERAQRRRREAGEGAKTESRRIGRPFGRSVSDGSMVSERVCLSPRGIALHKEKTTREPN